MDVKIVYVVVAVLPIRPFTLFALKLMIYTHIHFPDLNKQHNICSVIAFHA